MARLPRYYIADVPQHIIVRGNNGNTIFQDKDDYEYYLLQLAQACTKHQCDLHGYVLMPNHVHLLLTPRHEQSVGKAMQMIGRYYVQYFNHRYQRSGTLWEGRYKATLVDSKEYMLSCMRYIELNPVRANLAQEPAEYRWSSFGATALGKNDHLLKPAAEYLALGESPMARQSAYRALFEAELPEDVITTIRETTNKAWVMGGDEFSETIAKRANRRTTPKPRGGDRRSETFRRQQQEKTVPSQSH